MKDSDRYGDYRTGQNVVFKYVPDFSAPIMIEGVIKNIVTNGSGKKLEYFEVEAIKSKLMHFISSDEIYATVESCLLYTSPSPRDVEESRMPSSA